MPVFAQQSPENPFSGPPRFTDSLQVQAGVTGTVASKDYQPLWLTAKRFGTISDRKSDLSSHIMLRNSHALDANGDFYLRYGFNLYNNNHFSETFFEEGYVKAGYRNWELRAGRYEEISGEADPDLSSGAWGISGNALPIPKVSIALKDYVNVPFTNGWLQVKGQFSHGWMGDQQYIKGSYLHEKMLYLRIGKERLRVYGGIQHYALWGGNRFDLPPIKSSFSNYWDVLIGKVSDDGTVINTEIAPNRPGDHRGVLEGGIQWETDNIKLLLYNQSMFETGQNIDLKNTDRLLGLSYVNKKEEPFLEKATIEFINTKKMNDWLPLRVRESYYNNGVYLTGWEYRGNIIGTPLFINRNRGSKYFDNVEPFDWNAPKDSIVKKGWNIINNRVTGLHLGAKYNIANVLKARTLVTFTRNFGNYHTEPITTAMTQWYTLQEIIWPTPVKGITVNAGLAFDWGDFGGNTGGMLGIQWDLNGL